MKNARICSHIFCDERRVARKPKVPADTKRRWRPAPHNPRDEPSLSDVAKIFIVQPGLSKAQASTEQLELLSVTETYLMETYRLPLGL